MAKENEVKTISFKSSDLVHDYSQSAFGLPEYRNLKNREFIKSPEPEVRQEQITDAERLFMLIYSVNSRTHLPDGDIAMFMSDNTAPEIRDFISRNLMQDYGAKVDGAKYDGVDDDTLAMYTRNQGESLQDYRDRMYSVVYRQYQERQASKESE